MRKKIFLVFWAILLIGCSGFLFRGDPPDNGGWKIYFGNLHSHSSASDGVGSPSEAYTYAKDEGKLDFMCLGNKPLRFLTPMDGERFKEYLLNHE